MEPPLPRTEDLNVEQGEVVLTSLPQADGQLKTRPAIVLRVLPSFGNILVCGISTQTRYQVAGFDEVITSSDADFAASGLKFDFLIRLDFLTAQPMSDIVGIIGAVSPERHERLLRRLSDYLTANLSPF